MRKASLSVVVVLSLLSYVAGCGGGMHTNKGYGYEPAGPKVRLAILPTATGNTALTDSLFTLIFTDSARAQDIIPPDTIRERLAHDQHLVDLLNELGALTYSKDELKRNPSILNTLTNEEFNYLQAKLDRPTIALLPVAFNIKPFGMMTMGFAKMRLYDFTTGALIYERSQDLTVEAGGDAGKAWMAIGLIGFAKDDYIKYFWDGFVVRK